MPTLLFILKAMDPYEETFQTWNKLAKLYRDRFMDFDLYHGTYDTLCSVLPKGAKVLELGSGPGIIGKYLLQKRPDLDLLLTDVAPNMVKIAQEEVPEARTSILDVRKLDTLIERFDAILAGFVLPYLSGNDVKQLVINLKDRLVSRGWIYLSFVPGDPDASGFVSGEAGDQTYFQFHSEEFIHGLLKREGFEIKKEWRLPYSKSDGTEEVHTIVIAQHLNDLYTF